LAKLIQDNQAAFKKDMDSAILITCYRFFQNLERSCGVIRLHSARYWFRCFQFFFSGKSARAIVG
jgi:hypothetical protein